MNTYDFEDIKTSILYINDNRTNKKSFSEIFTDMENLKIDLNELYNNYIIFLNTENRKSLQANWNFWIDTYKYLSIHLNKPYQKLYK